LRRKTIAAKRGSGKLRIRRNLFIVLYAVAAMAAAEATQNESLRLTATPIIRAIPMYRRHQFFRVGGCMR
jgi:hypothetical protein